jgi:hypothetical protein
MSARKMAWLVIGDQSDGRRRADVGLLADGGRQGGGAAAKRISLGFLALLLVSLPSAASAKDVCVQTQFGRWLFQKVKPMKKRGSTVPLQGVYSEAGEAAPFHGTAYVRQDGQVTFGMLAHGLDPDNENVLRDVSMTFVGPATFVGATGGIDYDGDGATNEEETWEALDCDTLELP